MQVQVLVGIIAAIFAVGSVGTLAYFMLANRQQSNIRSLMGASGLGADGPAARNRQRLEDDPTGEQLTKLKAETKRRAAKSAGPTLEQKLFYAGIMSNEERVRFNRSRVVIPVILVPIFATLCAILSLKMIPIGVLFGLAWGYQLPLSILDRKITARGEEIMYYLPLVIEQISIGVSSSLDVGPCLQRVVQMADERNSHNVVTELIRHVQFYIRTGVSMDEALTEVGKASGHTELKHAFMSLAQVARHGGEVSKQLQELADAVSRQREAQIEGVIKKLELKATGPVGLVFLGFLLIFLSGLFIRLKNAL